MNKLERIIWPEHEQNKHYVKQNGGNFLLSFLNLLLSLYNNNCIG